MARQTRRAAPPDRDRGAPAPAFGTADTPLEPLRSPDDLDVLPGHHRRSPRHAGRRAPLARQLARRVAQRRRLQRRGRLDVRRTMRRSLRQRRRAVRPVVPPPAGVEGRRGRAVRPLGLGGRVRRVHPHPRPRPPPRAGPAALVRLRRRRGRGDRSGRAGRGSSPIPTTSCAGRGWWPATATATTAAPSSGSGPSTPRPCSRRGTTLIVTGDARTNFRAGGLAPFRLMAERARRTYWLNPEPRADWGHGDSQIGDYAPWLRRRVRGAVAAPAGRRRGHIV